MNRIRPSRNLAAFANYAAYAAFAALGAFTSLSSPAKAEEDGLLLEFEAPPREGERYVEARFHLWLPDPGTPVRSIIVHQHGCTNAAPDRHPPVTWDWHWRALARKHDSALLVPMYWVAGACDEWNDPESGSERALFDALAHFAERSGRPELTEAPWLFWGHSGGSSWSAQMILRHPDRVLAASFRGGSSKQFEVPEFREAFLETARELPLLFVWGLRESVPESRHFVSWTPMNTMFRELREAGGTVTRVIDPRSEHGCEDSRLMSIPFFDAVLSARADGETLPGAYGQIETHEIGEADSSDASDLARDPAHAWLPTPEFAERWREFSQVGTLRPTAGDLSAPELRARRTESGAVALSWRIVPEIAGGLRGLRLERDGELWQDLGVGPEESLATSRDSPPEALWVHGVLDETPGAAEYSLRWFDAAGNESPAVRVAALPAKP